MKRGFNDAVNLEQWVDLKGMYNEVFLHLKERSCSKERFSDLRQYHGHGMQGDGNAEVDIPGPGG